MCTYLLYCFSKFSCFSPSMKARLFPPKAGSAWGLMWLWVKRGVLWVTTNTNTFKIYFTLAGFANMPNEACHRSKENMKRTITTKNKIYKYLNFLRRI